MELEVTTELAAAANTGVIDLGSEALANVFGRLDGRELARAASVHPVWRCAITQDELLWRALLDRDFACTSHRTGPRRQAMDNAM
jgi:hypothetical protein